MLTIPEARRDITHQTDGPVTLFVLISRATELVEQGLADAETAANALAEELPLSHEHLNMTRAEFDTHTPIRFSLLTALAANPHMQTGFDNA